MPDAQTGLYFIAGALYGDPGPNADANGNVIVSPTGSVFISRSFGPNGGPANSVTQFGNAGKAAGGTAVYSVTSAGKDKVTVKGITLNFSIHSTPDMLTGATGRQVRAFLAGMMQGEGSQAGLIIDDPTTTHLDVIKQLLLRDEAYVVPTHDINPSGAFHSLYMDNLEADAPKVQAYPFAEYARCPGGPPVDGSIGSGGPR